MIAVGAWIILVQAFAKAKKTKAPNLDVNLNPRQSKPNNLILSPFRKGVKRNVLMQERLCSFSISSGSTLVQATLSCDN